MTEKKPWAHTGTTVFAAEFLFPQKIVNGYTLCSPSRNATQKVNFRTAGHGSLHLIDSLNAFYLIGLASSRSLHFSLFPNAAIFCSPSTPRFPPRSWKIFKREACFFIKVIYKTTLCLSPSGKDTYRFALFAGWGSVTWFFIVVCLFVLSLSGCQDN